MFQNVLLHMSNVPYHMNCITVQKIFSVVLWYSYYISDVCCAAQWSRRNIFIQWEMKRLTDRGKEMVQVETRGRHRAAEMWTSMLICTF